MITVNTNQASMLVRKNFRNSTNSLNTAIERLTTGYRINSAKDDAVGKAVSIDMDVKLSSNEVVQNNVEMGVSLLNTAEGNLNLIKDKVQRCRNLCEQALNGTYDSSSQNAIKAELNQLVAQINQIKETSEFNGITLFDSSGGGGGAGVSIEEVLPNLPQAQASEFISNVSTQNANTVIDSGTTDVSVAEANLRTALASSGTIGISSATGLQALANVVNGTNDTAIDCSGKTIVLTQDINLGSISNWTPIGTLYSYFDEERGTMVNVGQMFKGTFNGNGHQISNLKSSNSNLYDVAGLFGYAEGGTISNTNIVNANVSSSGYTGILVASMQNGEIINSRTNGNINSTGERIGGIIGDSMNTKILNSYSDANIYVNAPDAEIGGIVGTFYASDISNCIFKGNITATYNSVREIDTYSFTIGGIIGSNRFTGGSLSNCYSQATINASNNPQGNDNEGSSTIGGIAGIGIMQINNCASECILKDIQSDHTAIGGVSGFSAADENMSNAVIMNCYSKSKIITSSTNNKFSFSESPIEYTSVGNIIGFEYWTAMAIEYGLDLNEVLSSYSSYNIFSNCYYDGSLNQGIDLAGSCCFSTVAHDVGLDVTPNSTEVVDNTIKIQIGLDGSDDSSITFDFGFSIDSLNSIVMMPNQNMNLTTIDSILSEITSVETQIGAGLNRLESVQESLQTQHKTLTAARSIVKDADVSQESARYIRSQILQQASASLLTVANQSPSLMLSLINGMTR